MLSSLSGILALIRKSDNRTASSPLTFLSFTRFTLFVTIVAGWALPVAASGEEGTVAVLNPTTVPAQGDQSALLTLKAFGRYAVTVTSAQGVALQPVDRMSGAGQNYGEAGKEDGRLDLFLDRGEYKILTHASSRGKGQAKLAVHPFRELNSRPSRLIEQRLEQSTLGDFEQRSYWLEVSEKKTIAIEAAGRHLADLRLWRDGTWLVNVEPQLVVSQARPDRPLQIARFTAELEPGLYLVTAYGGRSQPWTEESSDKPFFLRLGIPAFGPALRQQFTMGELGVERFMVPDGPNFFRLELPEATAASIQVGGYNEHDPFQPGGASASIDKRSLPPVAELSNVGASGTRVVTITMAAGKPYTLQYFDASLVRSFNDGGKYWVSSIHAGYADDSIGATAVLTLRHRNGTYGAYGPEQYVDARVLELSKTPWHRRFNLLDELTLFVRLPETTKIRVIGQGVKARYRFEPFLTSRPANYQSPPWQDSGHEFELDRGLYVLTVQPVTKGILDLQLLPPGSVVQDVMSFLSKLAQSDDAAGAKGGAPGESLTPVTPVARFGEMQLDYDTMYTMYLNRQPGVASGLVLRPLPVDLQYALPVTQRAGENITIPVHLPEKGILRARAEDGRMLEIALDNGKRGTALEVEAGDYRVTVKGTAAVQVYALGLEPTRLASQTPLSPMPDATLAGLPKFPVITSGTPYYLDLQRNSSSDFRVQVAKPGLYRFETTGLLGTGGSVRTRINPSLFAETENGVGRNFLIQSYLREGEYQLTVNTQGETRGNLGVQVTRTGVVDGGELRPGEVARALLPSSQALMYRFHIAKGGSYRLQAIGLGRDFKLRLEDNDGWPPFAPVLNGNNTLVFKPGSYRMIVLPQTSDARVLTRLERVAGKPRYKGHGPHRIEVGMRIEHVWREPAGKAQRVPDQWEFNLPAAAELNIMLDNEMEATLVDAANPKNTLARVEAKRGWAGKLPAGRYRILASNSRTNNHVPYALQISATQLLAGQSREVLAPAEVPLSVGMDGLVELQSFGNSDVRARLFNASGELVAQNDDTPDDWNFHIARRLSPGEYKLMIDPVNDQQASTTVIMRAPGEVVEKPLTLGSDIEIRDDKVHVYPLVIPDGRNFLLASAQSSDTVGLALEGESAQGWVNLGTTLAKNPYLGLPLGAERMKSYRLRAWSADRRSLKVRVRASAASLSASSESDWLKGSLSLAKVDDTRGDVRVALVTTDRPGTFRIKGDLAGLQWSDTGLCAEQVSGNAVISVSGKTLLLVSRQHSGESARIAAERLRLPDAESPALRVELQGGRVGTIDLQQNTQGPTLAWAQARAGQPGISMNSKRNPAESGITPGDSVAVSLSGTGEPVRVWNASNYGEPLELDVSQVSLRRSGTRSLGFGASDGTIGARTALPIKLPGGKVRVNLTLPAMNAAVFLKRGAILTTHWSSSASLQEAVLTDADELLLLNADSNPVHYALEIAQDEGDEADTVLKPGELLERNTSTAGRLRVPVAIQKTSGEPLHLHVTGNTQALWVEDGGRITSGDDIEIHDSGVLWLQHQPGIIVAWLETSGVQGSKGIGDWFRSFKETTVKPPQTVSLRDKTQVLNIKPEHATLLHVRTSVPVVTYFSLEGQPPQTAAHLHGASINLLIPAQSSRLVLRAIGADKLSGVADIMATEAENLAEGAGPVVLLAPGSARLFSFELKQPAQVGIGVRASSDIVHSTLYNERGMVQSRGVVQMPTLPSGRYYLVIETPPDTTPVQVQPVVFGLTKPDTRPPLDILRRYVEGRDNDALLYVPPPPGVATDAGAGGKVPHKKKRRRAQPDEEQNEETGEPGAAPQEEGEPGPADPSQDGNEPEAGTNED